MAKFAIKNTNSAPNGIFEERGESTYLNYCAGWKRFEDFEDCRLYKSAAAAQEDIEDCLDLWDFWYEDQLEEDSMGSIDEEVRSTQKPSLVVVRVAFVEVDAYSQLKEIASKYDISMAG